MEKELCDCGKVAQWIYCPGYSSGDSPYSCDDCVHRGCTCNYRYISGDDYSDKEPTDEDKPFKWIEDGRVWVHLDEKDREFPCCEYDYSEEGYDKDESID